jgi:autotransporter strand-loop-strand O-heptosyltransferase
MYNVGWFYEDDKPNLNRNISDFKQIPLQQAASDILGLDPIEVKPKLKLNPNIKKEKQVSIAIHATAQSKYWNNPTGWQDVVDYLKDQGYTVKLLSSEGDNYMGNKHPKGIEQLPAGPIEKVIEELQKSEAFIGIGSGLSWLSWAVDIPTVLVSGFSAPYSEMQDNVIRISPPKGSCSGCYNRFKLDAGNWNWCPDTHKYEEFECTKSIESSQVISALKTIIK